MTRTPEGDEAQAPRSARQLKVGEEIRHALSDVLARDLLRDPDLAGRSITVTEVRMSPDLRHARAFVTPLGGGEADALVRALKRAAPFLRGEVARAVRLRLAPTIDFAADRSFDAAQRVQELLSLPQVRRDLPPPPARRRRKKG